MSRNWMAPATEGRLLDELATRRQRLSAARGSVTPQMGQLASSYADAYPWMESSAVQSLVQAGLSPDLPSVQSIADQAARQAAEDGEFTDAAEDVPDAWYESLWNAATGWTKPIVRTGFTILATPFEEIQALLSSAGTALLDETEAGEMGLLSNFGENISALLGELGDPGQLIDDFWTNYTEKAARSSGLLALGDLLKGETVHLGEGFLPGQRFDPETGEELDSIFAERQRDKYRLQLDGQFVTPGRLLARTMVEPGTGAYQVLSGAYDFVQNIALDPVALGTAGLSKAAKAHRTFRTIGAIPGVRKSVDVPTAVNHFLTQPQGQQLVRMWTENTDVATAFKSLGSPDLGGMGMEAARKLAATTDDAQTFRVLAGGEGEMGILGAVVRERPSQRFVKKTLERGMENDFGAMFGHGARVAEADTSRIGFLARAGRLGEDLPTGPINARNVDNAAVQLDRWMVNAQIPEAFRNEVIGELASVTGRASFEEVAETAAKTVSRFLENEWGVSAKRARELTTLFDDTVDGLRVFDLDDVGNHADVLKPLRPMVDGQQVDLSPMPAMIAELADDIMLPSVKEIRRIAPVVKELQGLYDSGLWKGTIDGIRAVQTAAWMPLNLLRNALTIRVVGDGQARMAGAGYDSLFNHPMDSISWFLGADPNTTRWRRFQQAITSDKNPVTLKPKGTHTVSGQDWEDFAWFTDSMERGSGGWRGYPGEIVSGNYVKAKYGQPGFYEGWSDKLSHMANDPVYRRVAGGLTGGDLRSIGRAEAGEHFDDVAEWFWSGTGQKFRKELASIEGRSALLTREGADGYLQQNFFDQLERVTKGDPDLVNMVATGQLDKISLRASGHKTKLTGVLAESYDHAAPDWIGTPLTMSKGRRNQAGEAFNHLMEAGFEKFLTNPENFLTKSPTFRQMYYERVEEVIGLAPRALQEEIVKGAKAAGMDDGYLARLATQMLKGEGDRLKATRIEFDEDMARLGGLSRDEFLETGEVLYRGSQTAEEGVRGGRAYFTDDPEVASRFAGAGFPERALSEVLDIDLVDDLDVADVQSLFDGGSGVQVALGDVDDTGELIYRTVSTPEELVAAAQESGVQYIDEVVVRQMRPDRAPNVTRTTVYGQTLDLTGILDETELPEGLLEALRSDRLIETVKHGDMVRMPDGSLRRHTGQPALKSAGWKQHERSFENTAEWMRQHGYGKARVPDDPNVSGPVSMIALDDFIDHPSSRFDVEQLVGRTEREVADISAGMRKVEMLAGGYAFSETRKLLYNLADRNQFMDMMKVIWPFGDVFKNVITSWAGIVRQNPQVLRRFQQGLNGARQPSVLGEAETTQGTGEGFFHRDPQTGDEVFTYPLLGKLATGMLGMPEGSVDFVGRTAGLNLATSTVLPGFGPAVSIPASHLIPNTPQWDTVRDIILPFGEQESIVEALTPRWAQNMKEFFSEPDPDKNRLFSNTVVDVMRALAPNHDLSTPEGQQTLLDEATAKAKQLYVIRGIAQFNVPTGPSLQWNAEDVQGNLVPVKILSDDLRALTEEYGGDRQAAFSEWVKKYGVDNLLSVMPKTTSIVERPVTEKGDAWLRAHPELERDFSMTVGFFAPEPAVGEFDYTAYLRQLEEGAREGISPAEQLALANDFLGRIQFEQAKKIAEFRSGPESSAWLAQVREQIAEEYPGFDGWVSRAVWEKKPKPDELISEIRDAVQNPDIARTDAGQGTILYLSAVQMAEAMVTRLPGNVKHYQQAKSARPIRDWLRSVAREIASQHPDFARVWGGAFERELADDQLAA